MTDAERAARSNNIVIAQIKVVRGNETAGLRGKIYAFKTDGLLLGSGSSKDVNSSQTTSNQRRRRMSEGDTPPLTDFRYFLPLYAPDGYNGDVELRFQPENSGDIIPLKSAKFRFRSEAEFGTLDAPFMASVAIRHHQHSLPKQLR